MTSVDALIPLTIRLQSLEAQVKGVSESYDADHAPTTITGRQTPASRAQTVMRRMQNTKEVLDRLAQESDGLKRLLDGYEGYRHLLTLSDGEAEDDLLNEVVPDAAKVSILVESRGDIIAAERDLREIQLLKDRGVEGSGNLEQLVRLRPQLSEQLSTSREKAQTVMKARTEVMALLRRYTEFTSTVSDMFVDLHHQLESLEEEVRRAERAKRNELKERY
ncbi:hypothetical protein DB88DRAFT_497673 [Papiliotrema laurentii]|uniref:Uncharacterized protein n=1 Tax=Papiliotrema laurentii TaxID=5418 RepID=A0AAD9D004_PAPLA|nr:hypothetical protein DB88DRAFT_497673 [Papiliotrema laurentii]